MSAFLDKGRMLSYCDIDSNCYYNCCIDGFCYPKSSCTSNSGNSNYISPGAIAGIVLGVIGFISMFITIGRCLYRFYKNRKLITDFHKRQKNKEKNEKIYVQTSNVNNEHHSEFLHQENKGIPEQLNLNENYNVAETNKDENITYYKEQYIAPNINNHSPLNNFQEDNKIIPQTMNQMPQTQVKDPNPPSVFYY